MGADQRLKDEITNDPNTRGYTGMTDLQVTDDLNSKATGLTQNRTSMSSSEIYNQVDETEWLALTDVQRQEIWDILHLGDVNPFGLEATRFTAIFPGAGATLTSLASSRVTAISRAQQLGLPFVSLGDVMAARA